MFSTDEVCLVRMNWIRGCWFLLARLAAARVEETVFPDAVGSTTVQTLHHGQLLRYPCSMFETLDMGDVSAQGPVD